MGKAREHFVKQEPRKALYILDFTRSLVRKSVPTSQNVL